MKYESLTAEQSRSFVFKAMKAGASAERLFIIRMLRLESGSLTRYYMGNYEEEVRNGNTRKIHYIIGGNGLAAVYVQNSGQDTLYYAHTDFQGSLVALTLSDGTVKERYAYDPWGNRRNPTNWTQRDTRTAFIFNRGYTLHEHLPEFSLINMNGRVYDPLTSIFFSPDPYLQAPGNWLNYNRYAYCFNNPLKYTDPDGENPIIIAAIIIGAVAGGYTGYKIADAKGYDLGNWQTWGYMLGGAVIGGASGYMGATIATGGGFMANTMGIMYSSAFNSMGMCALSGGMIAPSISFGVASYNFGTGDWGHLGKKGNKWYENVGYGFGALANVSDLVSLFWGGGENISANSKHIPDENGDWWGHHSLTYNKDGATQTLVSVGPDNPVQTLDIDGNKLSISQIYKNSIKGADTDWATHFGKKGTWELSLNNISTNAINHYTSGITRWDLLFNSCASHSARALWMAGVPNLFGFHPHLLNAQLLIRQLGIYSSPYLYQIPKY